MYLSKAYKDALRERVQRIRDRYGLASGLIEYRPELWDGPASSLVAAFEFAKAKLTGAKPNLGENRKVTVPL